MGNARDVTVKEPRPCSLEHDRLSGGPLISIYLFYDVVAILMSLALLGISRREVVMLKQVICFGILPSPKTRICRNLSSPLHQTF